MTSILENLSPVFVSITATDRSQAQAFAQQQPTAQNSRIYRNTLAVLATKRYLQMLGIEALLGESGSWNLLDRFMEDIADLYIPEAEGYLECRSIQAGDQKCLIPETAQDNRIGYVVLQLDEPYREATVLGFVPQVSVSELPLSYLQPLDQLVETITSKVIPQPPEPLVAAGPLCPIALQNWLKRLLANNWQFNQPGLLAPTNSLAMRSGGAQNTLQARIENLYAKQNAVLARHDLQPITADPSPQQALIQLMQTTENEEIRWQAAELLWEIDPHHPQGPIVTIKDLGLHLAGHQIGLITGILQKPDDRLLILLRLLPMDVQSPLPAGLKLIGLSHQNQVFFQVESRQQDQYIQFKFTADVGDRFGVQVILNNAAFTESFMV